MTHLPIVCYKMINNCYFFCYRFLDLCYKKLVLKKSNASDKCGFFRINRESVVPYTVKDNIKYVPLFYFEGETDHLNLKSDSVDSWDLAYLKFCCKVQGIRNELFASDTCSSFHSFQVLLSGLLAFFILFILCLVLSILSFFPSAMPLNTLYQVTL